MLPTRALLKSARSSEILESPFCWASLYLELAEMRQCMGERGGKKKSGMGGEKNKERERGRRKLRKEGERECNFGGPF